MGACGSPPPRGAGSQCKELLRRRPADGQRSRESPRDVPVGVGPRLTAPSSSQFQTRFSSFDLEPAPGSHDARNPAPTEHRRAAPGTQDTGTRTSAPKMSHFQPARCSGTVARGKILISRKKPAVARPIGVSVPELPASAAESRQADRKRESRSFGKFRLGRLGGNPASIWDVSGACAP